MKKYLLNKGKLYNFMGRNIKIHLINITKDNKKKELFKQLK